MYCHVLLATTAVALAALYFAVLRDRLINDTHAAHRLHREPTEARPLPGHRGHAAQPEPLGMATGRVRIG
jgi:hypothetical protein